MKKLLLSFIMLSGVFASAGGVYNAWGRSGSGDVYCYSFTSNGLLLSNQPVANASCGPTNYKYATSANGGTYCYEFTPNGSILNGGKTVDNAYCN